MKNIFEIIEALMGKEFKSSITIPSELKPNTSKIEQEESEQIKKIIEDIDLISKKISEKETTDNNSKCKYYLDSFFIPAIVAIVIILTMIFCIWNGNCDICCCKIVTYILSIVIIIGFAIFCCQWKNQIEKKYEKFSDLELKAKNDNLKKQSDIFEFKLSIYRHQLHQFEFREQVDKLLLDEYARDKEHLRKIDLKEQERMAALSDKIIEPGNIKNIVMMEDPLSIQRSILSNECCEELKEILKNYMIDFRPKCNYCCKCKKNSGV